MLGCRIVTDTQQKPNTNELGDLADKYGLYDPIEYTLEGGGKNTREIVIKYIQNLLMNEGNPLTKRIVTDINLLHNSSLIIDDIQDESIKRRGRDAAHIKHGTATCINSAYLQCFSLLNNIDKNYPCEISNSVKDIYHKYFELMHIGQGLDIEWTKNAIIPTTAEFDVMMDYKTGSGFSGPIELCLVSTELNKGVSSCPTDLFMDLGRSIGRFFQIRDDYINITCPKYWRLKTFCEDFDEKKVSYIFTLLKHNDSDDSSFQYMHSKQHLSNTDKLLLYRNLYNKQILHQTYEVLNEYKKDIIANEQKITGTNDISSFLTMFFEKLEYNLPIEPDKVKQLILLSNLG